MTPFDIIHDETKSALEHWLNHDSWSPQEALNLLCFLDPKSESSEYLGGSRGRKKIDILDWSVPEAKYEKEKLREIWNSGVSCGMHSDKNHPPAYFIEWAKKKGFGIPWLPWAEAAGLVPHVSQNATVKSVSDNTLLITIAALLASWPGGKQPSGKDLEKAASLVGLNISDDSIRKALNAAKELAPSLKSA